MTADDEEVGRHARRVARVASVPILSPRRRAFHVRLRACQVQRDEATDEFAAYFTGQTPKVMITTSRKPVGVRREERASVANASTQARTDDLRWHALPPCALCMTAGGVHVHPRAAVGHPRVALSPAQDVRHQGGGAVRQERDLHRPDPCQRVPQETTSVFSAVPGPTEARASPLTLSPLHPRVLPQRA